MVQTSLAAFLAERYKKKIGEIIFHKNVIFEMYFCGPLVGCSFCLSHCCVALKLSGGYVGSRIHGANFFGRISNTKHGKTNPLEKPVRLAQNPDIVENAVCLGAPKGKYPGNFSVFKRPKHKHFGNSSIIT